MSHLRCFLCDCRFCLGYTYIPLSSCCLCLSRSPPPIPDYCSMPQPTAGPMPDEDDRSNEGYTQAWKIVEAWKGMSVRRRSPESGETKEGTDSNSADHRDSTDLVSALLNLATESIPSYVEQSSLMMIVVPISKQ